jgi:hypothetical protein
MNLHIRSLIAIAVGLVVSRATAADRPNLAVILSETTYLAEKSPDKMKDLSALPDMLRTSARSRPLSR